MACYQVVERISYLRFYGSINFFNDIKIYFILRVLDASLSPWNVGHG